MGIDKCCFTSTPHHFKPVAIQLDLVGPLRPFGSLETGRQSMVSMKPAGRRERVLFLDMNFAGSGAS